MSGRARRSRQRATRRRSPPVHRQVDGAVEVPGVHGVDAVLQPRLLVEQLLHLLGFDRLTELRADLLEPPEQRPDLGDAFLHVAADVLRGIELGLLREITDPEARGGERLAEEVAVDAGHDAQQGGLAGAVGAQHPDLRPVEKRQPDSPEDLPLGRDDLPEILHDERVFAGHISLRAPWR
jgi:hypothetical protein